MENPKKKVVWLALGQKLLNVSDGILQQANFAEEDKHPSDHKIVALTLLCRTANNFAAARLLLEHGFIVEARTIVRCCFENFFWVGGLTENGDNFVKQMALDDIASKLKSGAALLQWAKNQPEELDFEKNLESFIAETRAKNPKASGINNKSVADGASIGDAYIFYRELSRDAAHPSATSLSRHLIEDPEKVADLTIAGEPLADPDEVIETIVFGCLAFLGVCVGVNNLIGKPEAGKELAELWEEYKTLHRPEAVGTA